MDTKVFSNTSFSVLDEDVNKKTSFTKEILEKEEKKIIIKQQYNEKINAIRTYFDVSAEAAVYIYYRRKRSFPWKKKGDQKYLYWNAKLLHKLIQMDNILDFDWRSMEFGKEEAVFDKYGIVDKEGYINFKKEDKKRRPEKYVDENGDEWEHKPSSFKVQESILQNIGLLPKPKY